MDQLWAPWRLSYVSQPKKRTVPDDTCFICENLKQSNDRDNLILQRRSDIVVVLNRFPYNNGHLLIAPLAHKGDFGELNEAEMMQSMHTIQEMLALLKETINADGFNVGLNLGKVAGAGLPGHLHWHIVPRWYGDTNFMPSIADTKVIVQSLHALYDLLAPMLK